MKSLLKITTVVILILFLQTCNKTKLPEVTTTDASEITAVSATSGGEVTNNGGDIVTSRGVCWSTDQNPTISSDTTINGSGNGPFNSKIVRLTANTTYYVRAYATNSKGVGYGNAVTFNTGTVQGAVLTTTAISAITSATAVSGGNITDDGGSSIIARGVCWSTNPNPTTANKVTTDGTGTGSFTSSLSNLLPSTTFHLRAYATNSAGTVYGNELTFATLCTIPAATTNAASNLGPNTATLNASANAYGSSTVVTFEYGLTTAYGLSAPAAQSPLTGNLITDVSAAITGLTQSTLYHYRVKAVSCGGTITGSDQSFQTTCTAPVPGLGTITQPTCTVATGSVVLNSLPATGTWTVTRTPGGIIATGTGNTTTITGLAPGTYTFSVTDPSGCVSPATGNVVINAQASSPTAPVVGAITQPTCTLATGSVALSGLPSDAWTVTRTPGGTATTGTGATATISGLAAGTYTFTVTNAGGCISTASGNVVVNPQPTTPPAPVVGAVTQPICPIATGSVALSGLPATGTWTLTRTPGGTTTTGTGATTNVPLLPAGATYTFTVTNAAGCSSVASHNVVIDVLTLPAATTNAASDITLTSATFNGTANGNGSPSVVTFQYGTTTDYGSELPSDQGTVTNGNIPVSRAVINLAMNTLYHYRVKVVSCAGSVYGLDQQFRTSINGLVAYYPFNGNANDESGNGNNGTLTSGATITTDKDGAANKACSVNPGFVQIADNASLQLTSYTLSIWFKTEQVTNSANGFNCLIGKNYVVSYAVGFDWGGSVDCPAPAGFIRNVRAYVANSGYFFTTTNIECGVWYHVAVTYDDATGIINLYINGNLSETGGMTPGSMKKSIDPLGIGKDGFNGDKFNGIVDEVSIFNRALTQNEITELFNNY